MKEIGEKLRAAREARKISLQEIQDTTKIRRRYLEAIESGAMEVIPGEVYRRGFIINYANAVGLDGEELLRQSELTKATPDKDGEGGRNQPEPEAASESLPTPSDAARAVPQPGEKRKLTFQTTLALAAALLLMVGLIIWMILSKQSVASKQVAVVNHQPASQADQASLTPSKATEGSSDNQTSEAETGAAEAVTTTQQIYPAPITVYAEFSEAVWIQIKADGKIKFRDNGVTFTAQSPKQLWTASQEMVIRIGNPAGIRLTLNGQELGLLGDYGKPRTITLTRNGMTED
jgi:cytoskeletal protein RodZ